MHAAVDDHVSQPPDTSELSACPRRPDFTHDMISTVSPTYARKIMTAEYGDGLDALLRARGMSEDHSWAHAAGLYARLYAAAVRARGR